MRCPHCYTINSDYSYKCTKCGKELATAPTAYKTETDYVAPSEQDNVAYCNPNEPSTTPKRTLTRNDLIHDVWESVFPDSNLFSKSNSLAKKNIKTYIIIHLVLIFVFGFSSVVSIAGIALAVKALKQFSREEDDKALSTVKVIKTLVYISIGLGFLGRMVHLPSIF